MTEHDPTLAVARDLTQTVALAQMLDEQAEHKPNAAIPGGDATVMLGPVANPEAWGWQVDAVEDYRSGLRESSLSGFQADLDPDTRAYLERRLAGHMASLVDHEDPDWEPPLQTLLWWSEQWRTERGNVTDMAQTIATEAGYLRQVLDWAWQTEPHFEDFADDIRAARNRLENVLYAGDRAVGGAPCLQCGKPLRRQNEPPEPCRCHRHRWPHTAHRDDRCCLRCLADAEHLDKHNQGGVQHGWYCHNRDCPVTFVSDEDYLRNVGSTYLYHADELTAADIAHRFPTVRPGTLRQWALRGYVRKAGRRQDGLMLYDVADVERMLAQETTPV